MDLIAQASPACRLQLCVDLVIPSLEMETWQLSLNHPVVLERRKKPVMMTISFQQNQELLYSGFH